MTEHGEDGADDVTAGEAVDDAPWWTLLPTERALIAAKRAGARRDFALLLAFFRSHGRFPRTPAEVDARAVASLAAQVDAGDVSDAEPRSERTQEGAVATSARNPPVRGAGRLARTAAGA